MDIRTLILTSSLTYLFLSIILLFTWQIYKKDFFGIGYWFEGMLFIALGFILISSRGVLNDFISIVLANTLIALGTALIYRGIRLFYDHKASMLNDGLNFSLVAGIFVTFYYFALINPNLSVRVILIYTVISFLLLRGIFIINNKRSVSPLPGQIMAGSIIMAVFSMLSFAILLIFMNLIPFLANYGGNYMGNANPQALSIVMFMISLIGLTFGFTLMISDRLQFNEKELAEERAMLLKEVHHRVKNNLAIIQSLLSLQSRKAEDERSRDMLLESTNRVLSISILHELLSKASDLKTLDVEDYISQLSSMVFQSYCLPEVTLNIEAPPQKLDVNTLIPCGLIINELITNSCKYAFPDGKAGEILVTFKSDDGEHTLSVKDNGVGMPEGFDISKSTSLGMSIIQSLSLQLGAKHEFIRKDGTEFIATFKENVIQNQTS
jgi:two-component sensor histidine kinase